MASSSVPLPPFVKPAFCKDFTLLDRIAYRGDTRSPEIIFREGFWNKQTAQYRWGDILRSGGPNDEERRWLNVRVDSHPDSAPLLPSDTEDPSRFIMPSLTPGTSEYRVGIKGDRSKFLRLRLSHARKDRSGNRVPIDGGVVRGNLTRHYYNNAPQYRDLAYTERTGNRAQFDMAQETAVCLTLRPDVAPYFPKETANPPGEWIWVYAVRLYSAFPTYRLQTRDRPEMTFAQEVAVERVPASYVICAVKCWRVGAYPNVQFNFTPRIWWNPGASVFERSRSMGEIARAFEPFQGYRAQCPVHVPSGSVPPLRRRIRELVLPDYPPPVTDIVPDTDERWKPF